jgi:hypothetical protein
MGGTRIHRILEEVGSIAFPGVFDTLSARLAHRAGFPMAFVFGYAVAATAIGEPDLGLLTQTEMIDLPRGPGGLPPDRPPRRTDRRPDLQDPTPASIPKPHPRTLRDLSE